MFVCAGKNISPNKPKSMTKKNGKEIEPNNESSNEERERERTSWRENWKKNII